MYAVLALVCLFLVNYCNAAEIKCDEQAKQLMDDTTNWLFFFGHPTRRLPTSPKERQIFCREKNEKEKYVRDYAQKCLKTFPRQVTSLLMYGVTKKNKYYCSSKRGKQELLDASKCGNAGKEKGNKCMNQLIDEAMANFHSPDKLKIPLICCTYHKFEDCIVTEANNIGAPSCNEKVIKLVDQILEGYTGEMINFICTDYNKETDKCAKILPQLPKITLNKERPKSILPPFIDILQSLP